MTSLLGLRDRQREVKARLHPRKADRHAPRTLGPLVPALAQRPLGRRRLPCEAVRGEEVKIGGGAGIRACHGGNRRTGTDARRGFADAARCGGAGAARNQFGAAGDRDRYHRRCRLVPARRRGERTRTTGTTASVGRVRHTTARADHYLTRVPSGEPPVVRRLRTRSTSSVSRRPVAPHTTPSSMSKNGTGK
jgi:hypothetical protein